PRRRSGRRRVHPDTHERGGRPGAAPQGTVTRSFRGRSRGPRVDVPSPTAATGAHARPAVGPRPGALEDDRAGLQVELEAHQAPDLFRGQLAGTQKSLPDVLEKAGREEV